MDVKKATRLAALCLLGLLAFSVPVRVAHAEGIESSVRAPEFTVQTVDGAEVSLAEQRGKLVLLSFFAMWCAPCREEVPVLNGLAADYADTLSVFAIGYEETDPDALLAVAKDFGLTVPVLLDAKGTLARGYGVTGLPRGILIGPFGYVLEVHRGMSAGIAGELRESIAAHSAAIRERRLRGLRVLIEDFTNVDDRGKKNGTGEATAAILREAIAAAGLSAAKDEADSTLIVSGTVSDLGPVVGVELVLRETREGRELSRGRSSVLGGKHEGLIKTCLDLLEPYRSQ